LRRFRVANLTEHRRCLCLCLCRSVYSGAAPVGKQRTLANICCYPRQMAFQAKPMSTKALGLPPKYDYQRIENDIDTVPPPWLMSISLEGL
jgi:hypothetical protein